MSSIRLMKTFLAVAEEGSFAAAAARVALTQAAVGQQMRTLEGELRRPLFERQGKSVALAQDGRALVPEIRRLVAQWEQLAARAPSSEAISGTVRLGAVVSAVRPLLQATLSLKDRHPALELQVSAAKSAELLAAVQAGELDAAVAVRQGGAASAALSWTPLYAEPLVLLVPRSVDDAPVRDLLHGQRFIRFDPRQHTGQLVERTLRRLRVKPQELLALNAIEGIVELVRAGVGVSVLPLLRGARWAHDPRLRVVEIPGADERRMGLVRRQGAPQAAAVAAVVRELQARAG